MHHDLAILTTLAVSLTAALVLGYITYLLKLSPIVGYLLAGVVVGPQTPGFVADQDTASQFAEIGVILLMFGVGLHFDLKDLLAVRRVALPGAIGQVAMATLTSAVVVAAAGWGWTAGWMIGLAASVASTVVLIRVLEDNNVLDTDQGHIAVGWLIVEDLFTVLVLVLLPALGDLLKSGGGAGALVASLAVAVVKMGVLAVLVLFIGRKVIPRVLERIARTRMRDLFTLTILVVALAIATGSAMVFGVSMALGAFLAGMVVGQSEVSHQAAADALPMRDAFAVLFFVSVGMLFDGQVIAEKPLLFIAMLGVILVIKPLAAFAIVWVLGHSFRTGLTVAIALAQIGEFSFILANLALDLELLPGAGRSLLVMCAIVSLALNPLLFRGIGPLERWLRRKPKLWQAITRRSETRARNLPRELQGVAAGDENDPPRAIVVGYGPVGRTASRILKDFGVEPVIVDLNIDTVMNVAATGGLAVYGDASRRDIQEAAGIRSAKYLLITIPDLATRTVIILIARELNPQIKVIVRARYLQERAWLEEIGATEVCYEEAEAAIGLAGVLLRQVGADEARIHTELVRIRNQWAMQERV